MEIHHQSVPEPRPPQGSSEWPRIDVTRGNRASIRKATDKLLEDRRTERSDVDREPAAADRLDLSQEAQQLAKQANLSSEPTEAELTRVRELRAQYESGALNTYERVQRAAEKLLGAP